MSKQQATCSIRRSTCRKKLNMFNLFRHVEWMKKSFDMLPKTATCRTATFDMSKQRSTCRIRHVASTCCWCGRGLRYNLWYKLTFFARPLRELSDFPDTNFTGGGQSHLSFLKMWPNYTKFWKKNIHHLCSPSLSYVRYVASFRIELECLKV